MIDQTEFLCKFAIDCNFYSMYYIREESQTGNVCEYAIRKNVDAIRYVRDKSTIVLRFTRLADSVPDDGCLCPICLEVLAGEDGNVTQTACNHLFHRDCICDLVVNGQFTCPLCRRSLFLST